jgi:hypothetical protein
VLGARARRERERKSLKGTHTEQDQAKFRHERASWAEIADGAAKCRVSMLQPPNEMFCYMPMNDSVVSDHCPAPYERCLEALLLQAGGALSDPQGWVSLLQVCGFPLLIDTGALDPSL